MPSYSGDNGSLSADNAPPSRDNGLSPQTLSCLPRQRPASVDNVLSPETMAENLETTARRRGQCRISPENAPSSRDDGLSPRTLGCLPRQRPVSVDNVLSPETMVENLETTARRRGQCRISPENAPSSRDDGLSLRTLGCLPRQRRKVWRRWTVTCGRWPISLDNEPLSVDSGSCRRPGMRSGPEREEALDSSRIPRRPSAAKSARASSG